MSRKRIQSNTMGTWLAVLFMCFLVLFPTGKAILETQLSARYLLAAIDSLEKGNLEDSQKSLERAIAWSDRTASSDDLIQIQMYYWILQGKSEEAIAQVRKRQGIERFQLAYIAYELFFSIGEFTNALVCAKILLDSPQLTTVEKLNQTAYIRSLAKVELDQALKDIETAVKADNSPSVIDTQAWVLHELGQNEEALILMNNAIERTEKQLKIDEKQTATTKETGIVPKSTESATGASSEKQLEDARFSETIAMRKSYVLDNAKPLKTLAVMYFHRAKILESLNEDAAADWKWLDEHGFKNRSLIY